MATKRITALPRREVKGIAIPWSLNGKNHEGVTTTWTRIQKEGQVGPVGQYWKTGEDGSFDKSVWVIEDDAPVVPTNVILEKAEAEPEIIATTKSKLQVRFTTNVGEQVDGWDAYEGDIVLGETPTHYVMAVEFDGFRWGEWGNTDKKFQESYGTGSNNAVPRDGNLLLGWRLNTKNSPTVSPTDNPWNPIKNLGGFDIDSQAMFTINDAFERRLQNAQGKSYWLIPKDTVSEAIFVPEEQSILGYDTPNLKPTKVLELTWMSPITKDPVVEATPQCRINFTQDGSTISDILNRKDTQGYVSYDEKRSLVMISLAGLSAEIAKRQLQRTGLKPRGGSYSSGVYKGMISSASYVVGDNPEIKQAETRRGVTLGSSTVIYLSGMRSDEVGFSYKDTVARDVGSVPTVGAPWPGLPYVPLTGGQSPGRAGYDEQGVLRPDPQQSARSSAPPPSKYTSTMTRNADGTYSYNTVVRNRPQNLNTVVKQAPIKTSVGTLTIHLDLIRNPPVKATKGNIRLTEVTVIGMQQVVMAARAR